MIVEYWVVYELTRPETAERDELRRFRDLDRAKAYAERVAKVHCCITSIDWVQWEVTRRGRDELEADCDLYAYGPDGALATYVSHP